MARTAAVRAALLCLGALTHACGSDDPRVKSTPEPQPIPGREALDSTPCDTQHRSSQLSRLELAACLRQTTPGELPTEPLQQRP